MKRKKLGVIINPIAGLGLGKRLLKYLSLGLQDSEFETVIMPTDGAGDAEEHARTSDGLDALVCIGGDGTINETINGLGKIGFRIPLGVIPVGSGNVIANELHLKPDIKQFVRLLKNKSIRVLDVGKIIFHAEEGEHERLFLSMAGIGFDAEVTHQHHLKRNGPDFFPHATSYLPLSVKIGLTHKLPRIKMEIDGHLISETASFIQIANARSYGGPFVFARTARPDDGWLDVVCFHARVNRDILRFYWDSIWMDITRGSGVHYRRGKEMRLSSAEPVRIQVDGDSCGYLPAQIHIIPHAISIFADPVSPNK